MNSRVIVFLIIAMGLEHIAGLIVHSQNKGSPLTRAMWILSWPFFMLAVGSLDYLADVTMWLRVPIAMVAGMVVALVWNMISSVLTSMGI